MRNKDRINPAHHSSSLSVPLAFLAGILLFGVYFPSLDGGFLMDDDIHLYNDPLITQPGGLFKIWFQPDQGGWPYWPIARTSLWLEWQWWGVHPTGYRVTNLVLHFLAGLVLWGGLSYIRFPAAAFAAILFWFHPLQVESVAWIAQRRGVLAGLFFLGACWLYWKHDRKPSPPAYLGALSLFILAVLSKTSVITLPLLLIIGRLWQKREWTRKHLIELLPFFLVALLKAYNELFSSMDNRMPLDLAWSNRLWLAFRNASFYLEKLFFPHPLSFNYPHWDLRDNIWLMALPGISWGGGLLLLVWIRREWSLGILWGILAYGVLLFPVMGLIGFGGMRYSYVADHWSHPASIPVFLLMSYGLYWLLEKINAFDHQRVFWGISVGLMMIGGGLSWHHAANFRSLAALSEDTIAKNPSAWLSYYNLGFTQMKHNPDTALANFNRALALNPDYPLALNNRGLLLTEQGKFELALQDFNRAIAVYPQHDKAYNNRGRVLFYQNHIEQALADFEKALQLNPDQPAYYSNRGGAHFLLGNLPQALADFDQALALNPHAADALSNRAIVLKKLSELSEK